MTMNKKIVLGLAVLALPATASEGAIDYRQHVMSAVGGHMQSMADILRQKVPHADHLAIHAGAMADLAGTVVPTLFPVGSQGGDALPAIWNRSDDFAARLDTLGRAAADLKAAAERGDGVAPAFQALGQACRDCHDSYRRK
jgi:cytochrome c556